MTLLSVKSAFNLELPVRPPEECKVLIVDDDERIVEAFSAILGQDGYQIHVAGDGQTALQQAHRHRPDVIVLDVNLPDQSGIEVCVQVKSDLDTRFIPVILVTGNNARAQRLEGLQARADDFLGKPVDPVELMARVRSLIRTKQLYDQVEAQRRELERRVEERTRELRMAYDRLQELDRVKSNILAIVSHELRTPLSHAKNALELATRSSISNDQKSELVTTATQAFESLEYRIGDIAVFSDPMDIKRIPASPLDLITSAVRQVRELRRHSDDDIRINVPSGLPPVLVDPSSMLRALVQLIDNAAKFGAGGPVTIVAISESDGVRLTIHDNGPGIAQEARKHLFMPLQPGDTTSTRKQGGLGIGLALVKLILDAHQIEINITSQAEKGTTVSLLMVRADT